MRVHSGSGSSFCFAGAVMLRMAGVRQYQWIRTRANVLYCCWRVAFERVVITRGLELEDAGSFPVYLIEADGFP